MYDSTVANTIRHAITAFLTGRVAPRSLKLKAGLAGFSGVMDLGLVWHEASESQELSRCCDRPCKRGWGVREEVEDR